MKIASQLGNTKADKAIKRANLLGANGRIVRYKGDRYCIIIEQVGDKILADAEEFGVPTESIISLNTNDTRARDIMKLCENRLYT